MSYQNIPSNDEDETAVLLVTTITPPTTTTTTMGHGATWTVAIVAGMMLVAGGVVLLQDGSSYTTAAEGLVVATQVDKPCLPAGGTFGGVSTTPSDSFSDNWFSSGQSTAFETCYQLGSEETYCWSKSYHHDYENNLDNENDDFRQCIPNGSAWQTVDPKYVNPVTTPYSCGTPCQGMYQAPT